MYMPKYVSVDDIPVQIPDDYSETQKLDALETAEASIELDLNGGEEITSEELKNVIRVAVKHKATCELIRGSSHPDDISLGDLEDDGSTKSDYAQTFCSNYNDLVQSILESDLIGEDTVVDPYVYTTRKPQ